MGRITEALERMGRVHAGHGPTGRAHIGSAASPRLLPAPAAAIAAPQKVPPRIAAAHAPEPTHSPRSAAIELLELNDAAFQAYRTLWQQIDKTLGGSGPRSIALTSAGADEEKTEVVTNLAYAAAQAGSQHVIVLDLDPAGHRVADRLRLRAVPGVTDVLLHGVSLEDALHRADSLGYAVLVAGRRVPEPAAVFAGRQMDALIRQLAQRYDLVIADAPHLGDDRLAGMIARRCDATFLVADVCRAGRRAMERAARLLDQAGARPRGCILTERRPPSR